MEAEVGMTALNTEGAISQGMLAAFRSWGGKSKHSPPEISRRE